MSNVFNDTLNSIKSITKSVEEISDNNKEAVNNIEKEDDPNNNTYDINNTSKLVLFGILIFTGFLFLLCIFCDVKWGKNVSYVLPYIISLALPEILTVKLKSYLERRNINKEIKNKEEK
jgi:hypothetical protein